MFYLYNLLQAIFLPVFFPFLAIFVLCSKKYRGRIPSRLGFGLAQKMEKLKSSNAPTNKTYWIHALSVGEVTSAIPLVAGIKENDPDCKVVFSATTNSGRTVADNLLHDLADIILDGPLDILPVIILFYSRIRPTCFILVETDFWPNVLLYHKKRQVPSFLVNGRVSEDSLQGYKRMTFFFKPMFQSFRALCMQTEIDKEKMATLGVDRTKLHTLGNLKFDTKNPLDDNSCSSTLKIKKYLPENKTIFIAGSTHPGEEKIIIESYSNVSQEHNNFFLIIAPRDPGRALEIQQLAQDFNLTATLRTEQPSPEADILILNTIGELAGCYALVDISFIGGSLVKKGGHNPIEPAIMATPVLFGPHMEDFIEISQSLITSGGAFEVGNSREMSVILKELLASEVLRKEKGLAAKRFVQQQQGVIRRHLKLIHQLL